MCARVIFLEVCVLPCFLTLLSMFALNGDVVTVTTPSDCRWLQVDFQPPGGGEEEKEEERRKIKVPATGNMVSNFCAAVFTLPSLCVWVHLASDCKKNHHV